MPIELVGPLREPTHPAWIKTALADFNAVLVDHVHAEKKAAANCMTLITAYPEYSELVTALIKVAQEELRHFQQVYDIMQQRGVALCRDDGDAYAQAMRKLVRSGRRERLLDLLLVSALIEARSAERLALLGEGLSEPSLKTFYQRLAHTEAGHYQLFVDLAEQIFGTNNVTPRLDDLARAEAEIMAALPCRARMH